MVDENCIFCGIANNAIQSVKIFDDNMCCAFFDINPATKGHIQVIGKEHFPLMALIPNEVKMKMFNIAFNFGDKIIKKLNATGVSYIINEGAGANQRVAHASINVIPRYEDDKVIISWEGIKFNNDNELNDYLSSILSELSSTDSDSSVSQLKNDDSLKEKKDVFLKKNEKKELKEDVEESVKIKPRIPKYW